MWFLQLCWVPQSVLEAETPWTHLSFWCSGLGPPHLPAGFKGKGVGGALQRGGEQIGEVYSPLPATPQKRFPLLYQPIPSTPQREKYSVNIQFSQKIKPFVQKKKLCSVAFLFP